jgi:hypothetical protein
MILNYYKLGKKNKGSKSVVCARVGGANTTSFLAAHFAKRNTKNCGGEKRSGESEGGQKFLPPNPLPFCPPERKSFCFCRAKRGNQISQSGFSSKKVRISSNRHHHIELATSLGASPLASAGSFASKSKGFLKSISSRPAARRRFIPQMRDIARRAMSRFFSFAVGERQSEILLNCRCAFPFSITIKE